MKVGSHLKYPEMTTESHIYPLAIRASGAKQKQGENLDALVGLKLNRAGPGTRPHIEKVEFSAGDVGECELLEETDPYTSMRAAVRTGSVMEFLDDKDQLKLVAACPRLILDSEKVRKRVIDIFKDPRKIRSPDEYAPIGFLRRYGFTPALESVVLDIMIRELPNDHSEKNAKFTFRPSYHLYPQFFVLTEALYGIDPEKKLRGIKAIARRMDSIKIREDRCWLYDTITKLAKSIPEDAVTKREDGRVISLRAEALSEIQFSKNFNFKGDPHEK